MRVLITHIGLTSSGAPRRREQRLTVDELKIGRAPSNDLSLPGLNVSIHHATIHLGQAAPLIESSESAELRINGRIEKTRRLQPNDLIRIGRWELRLGSPQANADLVLEVEEKELRGGELEELRGRTQLGVQRGLLTTRRLTWLALIAVLGLFLAGPLRFDWLTESWSSGTIARKHAFIADDCEKCHEVAFERVADASCGACHGGVSNHTAQEARSEEMTNFRCATCHKDHNGDAKLISMDQPLCEGCHTRVHEVFAASELANISDFGTDHPTFRFEVVTNADRGDRARLGAGPTLRERSGLNFDHLRHVGRLSPLPEGGRANLNCGYCHELDSAGLGMEPISFDRHCQGCHQLTFDAALPNAMAHHGDPAKMRTALRALYSERVLSGQVRESRAPNTVRFMRPGKTLSKRESKIVSVWVGNQVKSAEAYLMEEPGECATCHELREGAASDGGTQIAPVEISSDWLPRVRFAHSTHSPFQCRSCHPAAAVYDPEDDPNTPRPEWALADSHPYGLLTPSELRAESDETPSQSAADVMIPDRDQCRTCHLGMGAAPPAISSECVMCHPFHRSEHGPMQPTARPRLPQRGSTSTSRTLLLDAAAGNLLASAGSEYAFLPLTHRGVANRFGSPPKVDTMGNAVIR